MIFINVQQLYYIDYTNENINICGYVLLFQSIVYKSEQHIHYTGYDLKNVIIRFVTVDHNARTINKLSMQKVFDKKKYNNKPFNLIKNGVKNLGKSV